MIAKIKAIINKNEKILVFILILLAVSLIALNYNVELGANDELWNFSNILKMVNGYTIYKDLNVIITPLFFYVGKFLFKFLGSNYLIFKIYNIAIYTTLYYLIYKIFKQAKIKFNRLVFFLIVIYLFTFGTIFAGASYSILAIDFYLLGILLMIKGKDKIAQGIIIFLIFMTKQNVGIYYAIGYTLYELIENKSISKTIKKVLPAFLVSITLILAYLLYLFTTNNLYNFINYAFLGINEFGNKNLKYDKSILLFIVLMITIYSFMIWICHSEKVKIKNKEQFKILTYFSLPALLCIYPLMNEYHKVMGVIPTIITFIIIIEKSFFEELTNYRIVDIIIKIIDTISILIILVASTYIIINYTININKNTSYEIYYGENISEELKNNINNILNYIKENEKEGFNIKILSYRSSLYMNILNRNNKNMDLPFYGNLGKEGEEGLIKEIQELKNTKLLIYKEEDNVYQESKMVRKYIIENYEKIEEIEDFYVYKLGY